MKVGDSREFSYIVQIRKYVKKQAIIIMKFPQSPYTSQLYTFPQIPTMEKSKLSTTKPLFKVFF